MGVCGRGGLIAVVPVDLVVVVKVHISLYQHVIGDINVGKSLGRALTVVYNINNGDHRGGAQLQHLLVFGRGRLDADGQSHLVDGLVAEVHHGVADLFHPALAHVLVGEDDIALSLMVHDQTVLLKQQHSLTQGSPAHIELLRQNILPGQLVARLVFPFLQPACNCTIYLHVKRCLDVFLVINRACHVCLPFLYRDSINITQSLCHFNFTINFISIQLSTSNQSIHQFSQGFRPLGLLAHDQQDHQGDHVGQHLDDLGRNLDGRVI